MSSQKSADPWLTHVPGFPGVTVELYTYAEDGDPVAVYYYGFHDDLVAAGAATAEMLALCRPGHPRRDSAGERYRVTRWWRAKEGQPQRYYRVYRRSSQVDCLPGARESAENYARLCEERVAREERERAAACQPRLRLVVDNTRGIE
jgi:hypothetical protein